MISSPPDWRRTVADEIHKDVASDGTPIGSLNAAPNGDDEAVECRPATFDEQTGTVAVIERAISPDAILDGNDVPVEVIERVLPHYTDNAMRLKAIELYVTGDYSLHTIAERLKIPDRTVAKWAEDGNWINFNERMIETMKRHEKVRITAKRVKERERAIDEQIELGHKITAAGKDFIESAETAGQFKAAVEGVKLGSDMVGRALAINESGKVDAETNKDGSTDGGNKPLVMVFNGGGLPPVPKNAEVVDV